MAILATVVAFGSSRAAGAQHDPGSNGDPAVLTRARWQLTDVRSATTTYPVPATYRAQWQFNNSGHVSGLDGDNALAGTYRSAGNRLTIRITTAGTAGGTGTFPAAEAMSSTYTSTSLGQDSVTSTYTLSSRTLVLDTGHWTVTFSAQIPTGQSLPAPLRPTK